MSDTEFAKAWKAWLKSEDGKGCSDGVTTGQYLENRLWRAFTAGWMAAEQVSDRVLELEKALSEAKK